jgi:hypothetical protein
MYGMEELKKWIEKTETRVECPVEGCSEKVERQRVSFTTESKFKCPVHNIYISPSTFEYQSELDNLLWKDKVDLDLFEKIKLVKRESRIARERSEDAVSWNVFRFLEKQNLICDFLQKVAGISEDNAEVIYWSYSQSQHGTWFMLNEGRKEFELRPSKGSEPDIIILGKKTLVIIEAKFLDSNKSQVPPPRVEHTYISRGGGWWKQVFHSGFKTIAVENRKYELSRFWLIGSWIAKQLNLDFYLVNLTLSGRDGDIEQIFKEHINESSTRMFKRITWEEIYQYVLSTNLPEKDKDTMKKYFENKTRGYDGNGNLLRAFSIK